MKGGGGRKSRHESEPLDGQAPTSDAAQCLLAARDERSPIGKIQETEGKGPSSGHLISSAVLPGAVGESDPPRGDTERARSDGVGDDKLTTRSSADDTKQCLTVLPETTHVSGVTAKKRASLLPVLGFGVELDRTSGKVRAALVSEWPGIVSLHDVLEGKAGGIGGASQEDLVRWTRQVAEGLVQACSRSDVGGGGATALRVSSRNVFLFRRPKDILLGDGAELLDAKVSEQRHERARHIALQQASLTSSERGAKVTALAGTSPQGAMA